jgi:hypothetical protein
MHLSNLSQRIQLVGWKKIISDRKRNILRNVGKGWFSRVDCRVRNWPFRSYGTFMFGWKGVGVERSILAIPCFSSFLPDHVVRFSGR